MAGSVEIGSRLPVAMFADAAAEVPALAEPSNKPSILLNSRSPANEAERSKQTISGRVDGERERAETLKLQKKQKRA